MTFEARRPANCSVLCGLRGLVRYAEEKCDGVILFTANMLCIPKILSACRVEGVFFVQQRSMPPLQKSRENQLFEPQNYLLRAKSPERGSL